MQQKVKASHKIDMHSRHHIVPWGNPLREKTPTTFLKKNIS